MEVTDRQNEAQNGGETRREECLFEIRPFMSRRDAEMTSRGLGCGWLRHGPRDEWNPALVRTTLVAMLTLAMFFIVVLVAVRLAP